MTLVQQHKAGSLKRNRESFLTRQTWHEKMKIYCTKTPLIHDRFANVSRNVKNVESKLKIAKRFLCVCTVRLAVFSSTKIDEKLGRIEVKLVRYPIHTLVALRSKTTQTSPRSQLQFSSSCTYISSCCSVPSCFDEIPQIRWHPHNAVHWFELQRFEMGTKTTFSSKPKRRLTFDARQIWNVIFVCLSSELGDMWRHLTR